MKETLRRAFRVLPIVLLAAASGCTGVRTLSDPTLVVRTSAGTELGVSTDYGVVFLGRTAQSGRVYLTAWFGDGPQTESSVIEPVGSGVFTAETEIRLPEVPMNFQEILPGATVLVVGRRNGELWEKSVSVQGDPRVDGILLPGLRQLQSAPDQVGAGVFILRDEDEDEKELVGLVSGTLTLTDGAVTKHYTTVVGMKDVWRLVAHRRELDRRRPPVVRGDIE
ncbi:MAG: hypothetical protein ACKVXR_17635 [Planctomycetota bacterium]